MYQSNNPGPNNSTQLQTRLEPLLEGYKDYLTNQCRKIGLPKNLLNIDEHLKGLRELPEAFSSSGEGLHLFENSAGDPEGFCTIELVTLPQANNKKVAFIDNVFLGKSANQPEANFESSLAQHCRNVIKHVPAEASSVSLVTFSSDNNKKNVYKSLGAGDEPLCICPILELSEAKKITGAKGTPHRYSDEASKSQEAAREIAKIVYDYRKRRTDKAIKNNAAYKWPQPDEQHLTNHANYIYDRLLGCPDIPSTIVKDNRSVVAAGIGVAKPVQLNWSSKAPLSLGANDLSLSLDDFYVKLGKDWSEFGRTLFADIVNQISDETVKYVQFVQNEFDTESIEFGRDIGAKPCVEMYTLPFKGTSS